MATENKSPSYLRGRARDRATWLSRSWSYMRDLVRRQNPYTDLTKIFDDDRETRWEDLVEEYREAPLIAANNLAARQAFELARHAKGRLPAPPGVGTMRHFCSIPSGYHHRRALEVGDPHYWDNPKNLLRELLDHPEWASVPLDMIRGELENVQPKSRLIIKPGE